MTTLNQRYYIKDNIVLFTLGLADLDLREEMFEALPNTNDKSNLEQDKTIPLQFVKHIVPFPAFQHFVLMDYFPHIKPLFDKYNWRQVEQIDFESQTLWP